MSHTFTEPVITNVSGQWLDLQTDSLIVNRALTERLVGEVTLYTVTDGAINGEEEVDTNNPLS